MVNSTWASKLHVAKLHVVPERTEGDGGPASVPDSVSYNSYRRHRLVLSSV